MSVRPRRDERGLNESLQWALILPVVLIALLGVLQTAMWLHARQAVQHAAAAAAEAESVLAPASGAGDVAAQEITEVGGLRHVDVVVERRPREVRVTVSGQPQMIVEIGPARVSHTVVLPREAVTRP